MEEMCVELEAEEKKEEVEDSLEGSDKDLYTRLPIVQQPPPTLLNAKINVQGMEF